MSPIFINSSLLLIVVALLAYLIYALLLPENF